MPFDTTIAWLTFRQLFVRRRAIAAIVFAVIPAIIVLIFRVTHPDLAGSAAHAFLELRYRDLVIAALLPLTAVVIGTSAFGGEIDDGTIVYTLVKPIPRSTVVLTKYIVAVLSIFMLMAAAIVLSWIALLGFTDAGSMVGGFLAGSIVGSAIYAAMFLALGLLTNRALVVGLLYVVVIEMALSQRVAGLRAISVREFAMSVASRVGGLALPAGASPLVSSSTVIIMGAILLVGALAIAVRRFSRFEIAERGA